MPAAGPDPRLGMILAGKYRVDEKLGRGGMGTVYGATNVVIKKRVALKLLHAELTDEAESIARFRKEAIAASALEHPHILQVMDMGRAEDGSVFLVMERLHGRAYEEDLREEPIQPLGKTLRIVRQILDAVGAAHERGVVHRDLKPDNVLLVERGKERDFVKVVDFGISKLSTDTRQPSTATGVAMGTPHYMPLEQLRDAKSVDARADLYAVGVILFRALTGAFPFAADTLPELVMRVMTQGTPRLRERRPDLPASLDALVARLLARDAGARPSSCAEVDEALARVEREAAGGDAPGGVAVVARAVDARAPESDAWEIALARTQPARGEAPAIAGASEGGAAPDPRTGPSRSRRLWLGVGVAAAALALAALALAWSRPDGTQDEPQPTLAPQPPAAAADRPVDEPADAITSVPSGRPEAQPAPAAAQAPEVTAPRPDHRPPARRGSSAAALAAAPPQAREQQGAGSQDRRGTTEPAPLAPPAEPRPTPAATDAPPPDIATGFLR